MDVLDDLLGEAAEVNSENPWLTYGEPLHRLREFGITVKEMDLIDEAKLSSTQMRKVLSMLLGGDKDDYTPPEADWNAFAAQVEEKLGQVALVWSPRKKTMRPWIEMGKLRSMYDKNSCVIS